MGSARRVAIAAAENDLEIAGTLIRAGGEPLTEGRAAVIAATGHDEDNLVVCLLGKYEYKVPLTLARINNPKNEWLFTERFGVDVPVSQTSMISKLVQEGMGTA